VHVVNNTESDMTLKHSQSSLRVYQAADIMDVAVVVQLQHADVSALEVRRNP
jgi:subtilisin-like proprotein convertase family protein